MITMDQMSLSLSNLSQARESSQDPREILRNIYGGNMESIFGGREVPDDEIWFLLFRIAATSEGRKVAVKRHFIQDIQTVINLIANAERIVVLLGAGGSVGPDFRSSGGLYDQIQKAKALRDPCDVFDYRKYHENPALFWEFAHTIFPPEQPHYSKAQYFIEKLYKRKKLLRLYTQNVDTLEKGIPSDLLRCVHGSWNQNHCSECRKHFSLDFLRPFVDNRQVPKCPDCGSLIEPGIVFFGQNINFDDMEAYSDSQTADLLLVVGTSLKVAPISELPSMMSEVPSILINRSPIGVSFNAELLGDCDDIFSMLEYELGWTDQGLSSNSIYTFNSNKYIIPSKNHNGTHIHETVKADFLVYPQPFDAEDLN